MLVYSRTLSEQSLLLFNVFRILTMNYLLVLLGFLFVCWCVFPALRPEEEKKNRTEKEQKTERKKQCKICLISHNNRHEGIQGG